MEYITADTHFCHRNIVDFEPGRNIFADSDEMDEAIIANWNAVVTNEDIVHHLGDVGIGSKMRVLECVRRLNGRIIVYPGNHDDSKMLRLLEQMPRVSVGPLMERRKIDKKLIYLSHFPVEIGEGRARYFNFHGHIHSTPSRCWNQMNVGLDSELGMRYPFGQPIPLDDAVAEMLARFESRQTTE